MNRLSSNPARYSSVAMLLHWIIAIAVIANWRLAEAAEHGTKEAAQQIMGTHMALGIVIFVATVLRLAIRLRRKPPPFASSLKRWEVVLAKATHHTFYLLLLVLPILGWVAMSAYGERIDMFGWFDWPALPIAKSKDTAETLFEIHHTLGAIMVLLMFLHVFAVLKHTLFDRDGNLFRMLPFGQPRS